MGTTSLNQKFFGESDILNFTQFSVNKLMLKIVISVGIVTTLFLAPQTYKENHNIWEYIVSLSLIGFFIASFLTINLKRNMISLMLCIIPLFSVFLLMFYMGEHELFYGIWVLCIPVISLLAGLRIAMIISGISFLFILSVCLIPDFGNNYPAAVAIRYLVAYFTISLFAFVYEYAKNKAHHDYVKELEKLGQIDPLTELLNRRGFQQNLEMLCKQAIREELPISFMMIDIDHFKIFNDTHGHPKGDSCLLHCVKVFRNNVRRPLDLIVRMGGEEFGIFLFNTDFKDAVRIAEKIRENIETTDIEISENNFTRVTVSVGITSVDLRQRRTFNFDDMINEADKLLYCAKNMGRNKVLHSKI